MEHKLVIEQHLNGLAYAVAAACREGFIYCVCSANDDRYGGIGQFAIMSTENVQLTWEQTRDIILDARPDIVEDDEVDEPVTHRPNKYGNVTNHYLDLIADAYEVQWVASDDASINRMRLIMAIRNQGGSANEQLEALANGGEWIND